MERKGSEQASPLGKNLPVSGKPQGPNSAAVEKSHVLGLHLAVEMETCFPKRHDLDSYFAQFSKPYALGAQRKQRSSTSAAADEGTVKDSDILFRRQDVMY